MTKFKHELINIERSVIRSTWNNITWFLFYLLYLFNYLIFKTNYSIKISKPDGLPFYIIHNVQNDG